MGYKQTGAVSVTDKDFQTVEINGHRLSFVSFGSGEDMIFLHGWGASISAFLFVANAFSATHRVTVLDFAGFGDSEEPNEPYSVDKYADDVLKLLHYLSIDDGIFVGHSFGGRVCLELASRYPHIVRKLVLVDSAGIKPKRGIKYHLRVGLHKLLRKLGFGGLKGSSDFRTLSPMMKETFKNVVNYDQTYLLDKIKCPTAIFWGKNDKETPAYMAKKLNNGISDSVIFWLDGGHFSYAEDSSKFITILRAFAKER